VSKELGAAVVIGTAIAASTAILAIAVWAIGGQRTGRSAGSATG
jgi:hypothetical protein